MKYMTGVNKQSNANGHQGRADEVCTTSSAQTSVQTEKNM